MSLQTEREAAADWLAAGLCLQRAAKPSVDVVGESVSWVVAAASEHASLPPTGVIADLGRLLLGQTTDIAVARPGDRQLAAAMRAYEEHLLGRLLAVRGRLEPLRDAVARLPADLRPHAMAVMWEQLSARLGYQGRSVSAALARRVLQRPPEEIFDRGWAAISQRAEIRGWLADDYRQLAQAARRTGALIGSAEIFLLENLPALRSASQRLSLRHIADAAERIEQQLPRRIVPRRQDAGVVFTPLQDESDYPVGGYAELAPGANLENMVPSELVYMEDGADIDLFDVRFASGELQRYTRDESVFVRRHRELTVIFDESLVTCRVKDPSAPWQRLVLAVAMVVATVQKLIAWLDDVALSLQLVFIEPPPVGVAVTSPLQSSLAPERALAELLLREWIERGVVSVHSAQSSAEAAAEHIGPQPPGDIVSVLWVGGPSPPPPLAERPDGWAQLLLDGPQPELRLSDDQRGRRPPESVRQWRWGHITRRLLEATL